MTRPSSSTALLWCAAACVVVGLWLALDNPDIQGTSRDRDGSYTCLAPWDTVLNDADNVPGGEPPPDAEQIAERCRDAGTLRFVEAVGTTLAGLALAAVALGIRRRELDDES